MSTNLFYNEFWQLPDNESTVSIAWLLDGSIILRKVTAQQPHENISIPAQFHPIERLVKISQEHSV